MKLFSSIHGRLLVPLALAILVLGGLASYNAVYTRNLQSQQTQMIALRLAQYIALDQSRRVDDARQMLTLLATLNPKKLLDGGADCNATLAEIRQRQTRYANLGVIAPNGEVICSALPFDKSIRLDKRQYFRRTLETGSFALGDYQMGFITGRGSLNAGYPLLDDGGRVAAVVFVALDLGWLSQDLSKIPLPDSTIATLVGDDGTVLMRYPDDGLIGKPFGQGYSLPILSKTDETVGDFSNANGDSRLFASTLLPDWNGGSPRVIVSISSKAAYGDIDEMFLKQIMGLLFVSLMALSGAWLWARRLVLEPIDVLTRASQELHRGNLKARVALSLPVSEMAELATSFDAMAAALDEKYQQIERQDGELLTINNALETLSAGNHALLRAVDETQLLKEMCQAAVAVGGYPLAWVGYLQDNGNKPLVVVGQAGASGSFNPNWCESAGDGRAAERALRTARTVVSKNLCGETSASEWREFVDRFGLASCIAMPLVINGRAMGVFTIYSHRDDGFDSKEQAILEEMAQDLAFGINALRTRLQKDEAEEKIRYTAYHDPITTLPNYNQLMKWLAEAIVAQGQENPQFALLNMGLDRLRDISASLGYEVGNELLKEVATRVGKQLLPGERLARLQNDELAVFLPGANATDAKVRAGDILAVIAQQRYQLRDLNLAIHARAGIALYPKSATTPAELIQQAVTALYLARDNKDDCAFYSPKDNNNKKYLLELAGKLHEGLEKNQFELFYQPKICMTSGRVLGLEALARWFHPEDGFISPEVFIPVAEQTGMIHRLSRWVLETSAQQLQRWRQQGIHLPVAVNLSPQDIHDSDLCDFIEALVSRLQLDAGMLEVEITESAILEDPDFALQQLTRLRAMGISLYIDDFGTGFSCLGSLKKLPFNAIKIDKSFVIDMLKDGDAKVIVNSTIALAHELNLSVVAEGVETPEVWEELKALGCNTAQGYLMAKPMAAHAVDTWLGESSWGVH